jgi:hypothetical protein
MKGSIVLAVCIPHSRNVSYLSVLCPARVAEALIASLFLDINTEMLKRLKNSHLVMLKACKARNVYLIKAVFIRFFVSVNI